MLGIATSARVQAILPRIRTSRSGPSYNTDLDKTEGSGRVGRPPKTEILSLLPACLPACLPAYLPSISQSVRLSFRSFLSRPAPWRGVAWRGGILDPISTPS